MEESILAYYSRGIEYTWHGERGGTAVTNRQDSWSRKPRDHIFSGGHKAETTNRKWGKVMNSQSLPHDVVPQSRLYHLPQRAIWELRIKIPEPAWGVSHSNHHSVQTSMRTIFPSHDMFEILTLMKFMYCLTLIVTLTSYEFRRKAFRQQNHSLRHDEAEQEGKKSPFQFYFF